MALFGFLGGLFSWKINLITSTFDAIGNLFHGGGNNGGCDTGCNTNPGNDCGGNDGCGPTNCQPQPVDDCWW